jgi:hypothetical protein
MQVERIARTGIFLRSRTYTKTHEGERFVGLAVVRRFIAIVRENRRN